MMTKSIVPGMLFLGALFCTASAANAQCSGSDSRNIQINNAFQQVMRRYPNATECNVNRYAGGNFTASDLPDLVRASVVCSDPWIAQAFLKAGRMLNGHAPTVVGPEGPNSTRDACNYAQYGSWSNFPQLLAKISNTAPTPIAGPSVQVQITGPAQLASGGQANLTWSYSGTPTNCGSGVDVVMTGGPIRPNDSYKLARIMNLGARSMTFNMGDWSRSLTRDTDVYLSFLDLCSGKTIASNFQSRITLPARTVVTPPPVVAPQEKTEYCFGAVGKNCEGKGSDTPLQAQNSSQVMLLGVGCGPELNGVRMCFVAPGSIKHDNCCHGNPGGRACGGDIFKGTGCEDEWNRASSNVTNVRLWVAPFMANQPADLTRVPSGRYPPGERASTAALCAPENTNLDVDDEKFCCSQQFKGIYWFPIPQNQWGTCSAPGSRILMDVRTPRQATSGPPTTGPGRLPGPPSPADIQNARTRR